VKPVPIPGVRRQAVDEAVRVLANALLQRLDLTPTEAVAALTALLVGRLNTIDNPNQAEALAEAVIVKLQHRGPRHAVRH
jgi:hypothetical protein